MTGWHSMLDSVAISVQGNDLIKEFTLFALTFKLNAATHSEHVSYHMQTLNSEIFTQRVSSSFSAFDIYKQAALCFQILASFRPRLL